MLVWSQRSRERLKEFVSREVSSQMNSVGVATQADLDAVKKRVRDLERRAGMTASGRRSSAKKSTAKKSAAKKSTAKSTAKPRRRPHPRDRLRAPSAARRRARAPGTGEQSRGSAGRGRRGAGDRRREPGHEGRLAGRRRRPGAGDRAGASIRLPRGREAPVGPRSVRRRPPWPRLPRRGGVHRRVHRLPAAGGRRSGGGDRRRVRPARVGDPQRPARHGDGADERPEPRARATCRSCRT